MAGREGLSLQTGARIGVVGAGPAGCFFAHFALQAARLRGLDIQVVLYDGKSFARSGPVGCNMCAGVVAATLVDRLREMGMSLPENVVQRRVHGYLLHTLVGRLTLLPPVTSGPIYTVFRGNGPRGSAAGDRASFDDYLLEHVRHLGATVISEPVVNIRLPRQGAEKAAVTRQSGAVDEVDLVVGAFGMHGPLARLVADLGFGYRPPPSTHGYQAELLLGEDQVSRFFGDAVHIFALNLRGITFAAITPKRQHVTVTLVGDAAGPQALLTFLDHPLVRAHVPPDWQPSPDYCHCRPKVASGTCRHPYTDRLVVIGDASNSRLYKNGLESAYVTGRAAAETAVEHGISSEAWERHYLPVCRSIAQDSLFGHALFWTKDHLFSVRPLARMLVRAADREQQLYPSPDRIINQSLWSMFTGDRSYRWIARTALRPRVQARFWRHGLPALWPGHGGEGR